MFTSRRALLIGAIAWFCLSVAQAESARSDSVDFSGEAASPDARYAAQWVLDQHDNGGMPFAIVDKKGAKAYLFSADGRLIGASPVLLGMARGDDSAPGVGNIPPSRIPVAERTTPAGRFVTEPGHNVEGEDVVWFDYGAALAIHRLRSNAAYPARVQRMASQSPVAHRVSAGCVVVPAAFYESVVRPVFGHQPGVVYVLPETRPVHEMLAQRDVEV